MLTPAVVVDLDGTILHLESETIKITGSSTNSFLSKGSFELLKQISLITPLIIATARNTTSVKQLVDQTIGVKWAGFVMENGLVTKHKLEPFNDVQDLWTEITNNLPEWRKLNGYEACLGLIPPSNLDNPEKVLEKMLKKFSQKGLIYKDRHKLFVYPENTNKFLGLSKLNFEPWIVLGNDINDYELMDKAKFPATLLSATPEIINLVLRKKGYCSSKTSHSGSEDLLNWSLKKLASLS